MKQFCAVVFFYLILCAGAFSQDRSIIQCDADMEQVPAWTAPGSAYVVEQLSCGQMVSSIGLERGYIKIQIGRRTAYVYAKYVRQLESEGKLILQSERIEIPPQPPQSPQLPESFQSQEQAPVIQCDLGSTARVPAWASPGGVDIVDYLSCGQIVSIISRERGDFKIKIGDRIAYMNAKYIKFPQTREQGLIEPEAQAKGFQQLPVSATAATQPLLENAKADTTGRSISVYQTRKQIVEENTTANSAIAQGKLRVFVTDSQSWEERSAVSIYNGSGGGLSRGGARPQNAEIAKTFGKRCPQITVTINQQKANYVVTLDHEGGKGYARKDNKWAAYNKDGDMIGSGSTRSLGNSVKDACAAILNDRSGSQ